MKKEYSHTKLTPDTKIYMFWLISFFGSKTMIDIKGNSVDRLTARLSNFTPRRFMFDEVPCLCLEGILQALKCSDPSIQADLCSQNGREAQQRGQMFNTWKIDQTLWWKEQPYGRSTSDYTRLITTIYNSVFEQDATFRIDLLAIGYEEISHSIGKSDMQDTVLTEVEMLYQLNRLRLEAFKVTN